MILALTKLAGLSSGRFTKITELLNDTCLAVGSEAYAAALQVYSYAKASGNVGGMDAVVGEMGQRFARKPRKAKSQEATVKSEGVTV
jgi:hypothetical protein